jgi:hypothetical protein
MLSILAMGQKMVTLPSKFGERTSARLETTPGVDLVLELQLLTSRVKPTSNAAVRLPM